MKFGDFLLNAHNDVDIVNARRETEVYIKYDILNREIKSIKAGDGEFMVVLEEENND